MSPKAVEMKKKCVWANKLNDCLATLVGVSSDEELRGCMIRAYGPFSKVAIKCVKLKNRVRSKKVRKLLEKFLMLSYMIRKDLPECDQKQSHPLSYEKLVSIFLPHYINMTMLSDDVSQEVKCSTISMHLFLILDSSVMHLVEAFINVCIDLFADVSADYLPLYKKIIDRCAAVEMDIDLYMRCILMSRQWYQILPSNLKKDVFTCVTKIDKGATMRKTVKDILKSDCPKLKSKNQVGATITKKLSRQGQARLLRYLNKEGLASLKDAIAREMQPYAKLKEAPNSPSTGELFFVDKKADASIFGSFSKNHDENHEKSGEKPISGDEESEKTHFETDDLIADIDIAVPGSERGSKRKSEFSNSRFVTNGNKRKKLGTVDSDEFSGAEEPQSLKQEESDSNEVDANVSENSSDDEKSAGKIRTAIKNKIRKNEFTKQSQSMSLSCAKAGDETEESSVEDEISDTQKPQGLEIEDGKTAEESDSNEDDIQVAENSSEDEESQGKRHTAIKDGTRKNDLKKQFQPINKAGDEADEISDTKKPQGLENKDGKEAKEFDSNEDDIQIVEDSSDDEKRQGKRYTAIKDGTRNNDLKKQLQPINKAGDEANESSIENETSETDKPQGVQKDEKAKEDGGQVSGSSSDDTESLGEGLTVLDVAYRKANELYKQLHPKNFPCIKPCKRPNEVPRPEEPRVLQTKDGEEAEKSKSNENDARTPENSPKSSIRNRILSSFKDVTPNSTLSPSNRRSLASHANRHTPKRGLGIEMDDAANVRSNTRKGSGIIALESLDEEDSAVNEPMPGSSSARKQQESAVQEVSSLDSDPDEEIILKRRINMSTFQIDSDSEVCRESENEVDDVVVDSEDEEDVKVASFFEDEAEEDNRREDASDASDESDINDFLNDKTSESGSEESETSWSRTLEKVARKSKSPSASPAKRTPKPSPNSDKRYPRKQGNLPSAALSGRRKSSVSPLTSSPPIPFIKLVNLNTSATHSSSEDENGSDCVEKAPISTPGRVLRDVGTPVSGLVKPRGNRGQAKSEPRKTGKRNKIAETPIIRQGRYAKKRAAASAVSNRTNLRTRIYSSGDSDEKTSPPRRVQVVDRTPTLAYASPRSNGTHEHSEPRETGKKMDVTVTPVTKQGMAARKRVAASAVPALAARRAKIDLENSEKEEKAARTPVSNAKPKIVSKTSPRKLRSGYELRSRN